MRTATWLAVGVTAVVLAGAAPGRPDPDKPGKADKEVKVATLKDAAAAFAKSVAAEVGKDGELKYAAQIASSACRGGYEPVSQIYDALKQDVKAIKWGAKKPAVAADEQLAVVIEDAKNNRTFRFAVALEERDDPNNPAETLYVLRCTSATLKVTYEVIDQNVIGEFLKVPVKNDRKIGGLIIAPVPAKIDPDLDTQIAVPGFGVVKIHKREGKDGIDPAPLPFEVRKLNLTPTVPGWRYRCKELTAETTFEVVLYNEQSHAWAIEVELDGRSSTAEAGGRFAGAKYIIPAKEGGKAAPCFIKGWLREPKGKAGADGVQPFEYTEFLVKNVPDKDPALNKITAEHQSTIRIAWYAAWPTGENRPKGLPNPQSGGTDIVGDGKHGTQNLKVVKYDTDKQPMGSVVIEFGGLAAKE